MRHEATARRRARRPRPARRRRAATTTTTATRPTRPSRRSRPATSPDTAATTPATEPPGSGHHGGRDRRRSRRRSSRCRRRATEMLFAIGAGDQVIAVDDLSNYPPEAAAKMTDLSGFEPNVEAIAGYEPDLVVTDGTNPDLLAQLDSLGIAHWEGPAAVDVRRHLRADRAARRGDRPRRRGGRAGRPDADRHRRGDRRRCPTLRDAADRTTTSSTTPYFTRHVATRSSARCTRCSGCATSPTRPRATAAPYPQLNAEFIISADPDLIFLAGTKCCGETRRDGRRPPRLGRAHGGRRTATSSRWTTTSRRAGDRASSTTSEQVADAVPTVVAGSPTG